jgi:uncharacterized membrane protein
MVMGAARLFRHLVANRRRVRSAFAPAALARISEAIAASERRHGGQIRVVIEGALDGEQLFAQQSARERAIDVFAQQRVWDTEANNGVLIYLLLADRDVEIVADRGIHARVGEAAWRGICATMEQAFARGEYEAGVLAGIQAATNHLAAHFPRQGAGANELPDDPVLL